MSAPAIIPLRLRLRTLVDRTAELTGVSTALILGAATRAEVVRARYAAVWVAHHALGMSNALIARGIGDRDSSTISVALRRAAERRDQDPPFRALTEQLARAVREGATPALAALTEPGLRGPRAGAAL